VDRRRPSGQCWQGLPRSSDICAVPAWPAPFHLGCRILQDLQCSFRALALIQAGKFCRELRLIMPGSRVRFPPFPPNLSSTCEGPPRTHNRKCGRLPETKSHAFSAYEIRRRRIVRHDVVGLVPQQRLTILKRHPRRAYAVAKGVLEIVHPDAPEYIRTRTAQLLLVSLGRATPSALCGISLGFPGPTMSGSTS
jgi:hypothetical protein